MKVVVFRLILWCLLPICCFASDKSLQLKHYYCTASDDKYYNCLLNLIGSIHKVDFDNLGEIAVFDLGLTEKQKQQLAQIMHVRVYAVEMTNPRLLEHVVTASNGRKVRGSFAWKPVIIKQALEKFPEILYLDAGTTVLKPLDCLFQYIHENGYFLMSCSAEPHNNIVNRVTKKVFNNIIKPLEQSVQNHLLAENTISIDAGMQGISRAMLKTYILPMYEHSKDLALFEDDGSARYGYGAGRHDQILFSIYAHCLNLKIHDEGLITLKINNQSKHIHIHNEHVTENTYIYRSREDINFQGGKTQFIRYSA